MAPSSPLCSFPNVLAANVLPAVLVTVSISAVEAGGRGEGPEPTFVEADVGVDFVHDNGRSGRLHFPEIVGGGGALVDYDGDGDLDLYLVQSGRLVPANDSASPPPGDRLFRNELVPGGELRFTEVTAQSGIQATAYGMGAASGDVDNDGRPDLYVTQLGSNLLLRNQGDGTFADVTRSAGADDPRWSVSAAFFDYDRDGWLDLFVVNYVDFSLAAEVECYATSSARDYCGPDAYPAQVDSLFRNRGDGSFEDVSQRAGIRRAYGAGLGVVTADLDGDGWLDVYVANDGDPNQLWHNGGDGRFRDEALLAGVALNRHGQAEAGMGVDAGDYDRDGDDDLFVTHLTEETNTLYVNHGGLLFDDRTIAANLHASSLPFTGFGTGWFDFDNDGDLDLVVLNGAVRIIEELVRQGVPYPLGQSNQLFRNDGRGSFVEVRAEAGPAMQELEASRGVLIGDLDNDGDPDLVVLNSHARARVLINRIGQHEPWIGLRVVAGDPARDALGSRVELRLEDGGARWCRVSTDGGYATAGDSRVRFGLGGGAAAAAVRVHWLAGGVEEWRGLEPGRYHILSRGAGTPLDSPATAEKEER